ncbi:hypothetical protein M9458_029528, partial [Cirrhinus mrigala]
PMRIGEWNLHATPHPRTYGYIRWRRATTHSDEADRMSIAASEEELTPDEAEESSEQLPAAVAAQSEADAELGAMLLWAPKSIGLVVHKAPSPEPSQPLCPQNAAAWRNRPRLPSKACKLSSALAAKAYSAAGQAASALHAMDILQVLQAQALKQLHEGRPDKGLMQELRYGDRLHPPGDQGHRTVPWSGDGCVRRLRFFWRRTQSAS